MIPVVSMNKTGDLSYQVFNDNLTPAEQINRKMFAAYYTLQDKLTNGWSNVERLIGAGKNPDGTDLDIDALNTKADAVTAAVKTLVEAIDALK